MILSIDFFDSFKKKTGPELQKKPSKPFKYQQKPLNQSNQQYIEIRSIFRVFT